MSDEENVNVQEQTPEAVVQATEPEVAETRQETEQQRKQRNDVEYNWAEARRKMQERDHEVEELKKQLNQMQSQSSQKEDDEIDKLADDDIITAAQARKFAEKTARKVAEEVMKRREAETVEERARLKFQDYDAIVTRENIDFLKQTEPEIALSLANNPDPYAQAIAVYKTLKKLGVEENMERAKEKQKAVQNSQKPVSVNAVNKASPLSNAHVFEAGLTKELKAQLYKEMQEAAKRA